ncbi:hypothetical protein [Fulvivirga kasyanovii]|uniref:Secreted protein n=1 Tax=Fulvivirga kasyanovii TaxID=396812 RepID=A0ABW9RLU9_9BACT|nr:hypothetical protein [Fulvivirga kasyanovii]MTI24961.1 hypothetical protein [Fulvivirga kasyanovii]
MQRHFSRQLLTLPLSVVTVHGVCGETYRTTSDTIYPEPTLVEGVGGKYAFRKLSNFLPACFYNRSHHFSNPLQTILT